MVNVTVRTLLFIGEYIFTQPLCHSLDMMQGQFFGESTDGLNREFPSLRLVTLTRLENLVYSTGCFTKAREPRLSYYLPII